MSRFEIVSGWIPDEWPVVGRKVYIPTGPCSVDTAQIVESHEGVKLVAVLKGVRYVGRPQSVIDHESASKKPVNVWWWEVEKFP